MRAKWAAGVAAAVGLIVGAVLAVPSGASAADGQPVLLGRENASQGPTRIAGTLWLDGILTAGEGTLVGSFDAVGDDSQLEYALSVGKDDGEGGLHVATNGVGLATIAASNDRGEVALLTGRGTGQTVLKAEHLGASGRGAEVGGQAAALRILPTTATNHPKSGLLGDLYLDKSGRLWFCKGGTTWKQLA